ncbi:MAG TPA: GGDEF domain-containing protein [Thermoanaerobaculia bacterium]
MTAAPLPELPPAVEMVMHRLITEYSTDLISIHRANGDYAYVSPNSEAFFGWKAEELIGRSAYALFHPADLKRISGDHAKNFKQGEKPRVRYRLRTAAGRYRWVESRSRPTEDMAYLVIVTRDIHAETLARRRLERERKARQSELVRQAYTDSLTGLPNRRALDEALAREVERSRRGGKPVAVAVFDVDRFKTINDEWGHHAGDAVLQSVARSIAASTRAYDVAGRWGGDEILVILPETGIAEAQRFAERVRAEVEVASFPGFGRMTLSGGVSAATRPAGADELLRAADVALLRAKEKGRNRIEAA